MKAEYITLDWLYERVFERGDCLIWKGTLAGRSSSPQAKVNGKHVQVRRFVWELANEKKIRKGYRVFDTCNNPNCVNPDHLVSKTYNAHNIGKPCSLMHANSIAKARRSSSKITNEQTAAIRASNEKGVLLAEQYGISDSYVCDIRLGRRRLDYSNNPFAGLGS